MGRECRCARCRAHRNAKSPLAERKLRVRKWHYVGIGVTLFVIGLLVIGEKFTIGVIFARVLDALGDIVVDRGIEG